MINTVFKKWLGVVLVVLTFFFALNGEAQTRSTITLREGWKFIKGDPQGAAATDYNDSKWQEVTVPHDWAITGPFIPDGNGSTAKLPWKGQGWYRKQFEIAAADKNKRVHIIFDGVMAFPQVFVNGKLVGSWDYGYNSFYLDITDYLHFGEKNVLAVHADTRKHDSRWYPGAGIYRKVQLLITNPVYADIWGTYVTTPIVKEHEADVRISTSVQNQFTKTTRVRIEQMIFDPEDELVGKDTVSKSILAGRVKDLEVTIHLKDSKRWDVENPVLYKAVTHIYSSGMLVDVDTTAFGIRTIKFTADDGFHLNGRRVQLKGVNLHHDLGPLGAAFNLRAMERELEIMKDMGVNAIRNSHNIAAPELLTLCDKMGLLVFDEAFDKYDAKADILDTTHFEAFTHRNIRNFVVRDRNHPSVFIWSVGNEIGDVQWNIDNGFKRLHTMINYVNKYDPTRPTTLVCDNMESARLRHFDYYDVHSWNYGRRYRLARKLEPNKSVIISESASTVSTRGFYEFPLPLKPTDFTASLHVSSYDLNAPEWAEISDDDFMWQQEEKFVAGEFVWTGFDYLGEPTPYNNKVVKEMGLSDEEASRSSYFGIVDLVGIPKDRYYLYKSYWKPEETTIHILPHWNWEGREGELVPVFVYTNGDCAELFVNGKSQGKQCKKPGSTNSTERFRLMWKDVFYEQGEVKVVAYTGGSEIGEEVMKTAGKPHNIKLSPDRKNIKADGKDLSYILVEALDAQGNPHPLADNKINIKVSGPAHVAGVGNGNPQSFESFQANFVYLFNGKAMIILESEHKKGEARVSVSADGLVKDSVSIKLQ